MPIVVRFRNTNSNERQVPVSNWCMFEHYKNSFHSLVDDITNLIENIRRIPMAYVNLIEEGLKHIPDLLMHPIKGLLRGLRTGLIGGLSGAMEALVTSLQEMYAKSIANVLKGERIAIM